MNIKNNHNSPPPAYAVLPPDHDPSATCSQQQASSSSPSVPNAHLSPQPYHPAPPAPYLDHPHFGPTPISSEHPLLPYAYYDSPSVADGRARMRFVGAFVCGVGVWLVIGCGMAWGRMFDWY